MTAILLLQRKMKWGWPVELHLAAWLDRARHVGGLFTGRGVVSCTNMGHESEIREKI